MTSFLSHVKSIKLHNRILLALVLGAFFGSLYNVSKYKLEVSYLVGEEVHGRIVENWEKMEFRRTSTNEIIASFGSEDQSKLLIFYNSLKKPERDGLVLDVALSTSEESGRAITTRSTISGITDIQKVKTIAVHIKPIGSLFIRLLMFLAIPLVVASLIVGAASLGDIRKVGRIGSKTLALYLVTTAVAITVGLVLANALEPGKRLSADSRERLLVENAGNIQQKIKQQTAIDVVQTIVEIVPTNPISAMANSEMLQVVFFAVIVGVTLTLAPKNKSRPVVNFFDGFSDTMIKMVDLVMTIAPFGVFALIAATVAEFGFDILQTLAWYAGVLVLGLVVHMTLIYGSLLRFGAGMSLARFYRGMRDAMLIAFTTSSSAATLPVNMECCEQNLGVPKTITSFVLPLGATINMDGTAMYQAVASVFIAQVYGLDLHLSDQLTILLTATLASIGTAPVPGVGLVMLIIVLRAVHVPEEGIALIVGIDRILDMCRTTVNITGDAACAAVVAKSEGVLGRTKDYSS